MSTQCSRILQFYLQLYACLPPKDYPISALNLSIQFCSVQHSFIGVAHMIHIDHMIHSMHKLNAWPGTKWPWRDAFAASQLFWTDSRYIKKKSINVTRSASYCHKKTKHNWMITRYCEPSMIFTHYPSPFLRRTHCEIWHPLCTVEHNKRFYSLC